MHIAVLGITGSVGQHAARAFLAHGHTVTALVRTPGRVPPADGLSFVVGSATSAQDLDRALEGADVVLHALNLPYPQWDPGMIELHAAVIAAAERAGATLLFPGNVYGLGPDYSKPLTEDDPHQPVSRKGALRNRMEAMLAAAAVPTVILRAGDYFGEGSTAWMHHLTARVAGGGAIQYGGDPEVLHCWAYLPDVAEAFVALAERRAELEGHAVFHFEGHVVDGHAFTQAIRAALGDPTRPVRAFPWLWMNLLRPFVPMVRELFEMRYLWDQPVRLDGSRLRALLGTEPRTPYAQAVAQTVQPAQRAAA